MLAHSCFLFVWRFLVFWLQKWSIELKFAKKSLGNQTVVFRVPSLRAKTFTQHRATGSVVENVITAASRNARPPRENWGHGTWKLLFGPRKPFSDHLRCVLRWASSRLSHLTLLLLICISLIFLSACLRWAWCGTLFLSAGSFTKIY